MAWQKKYLSDEEKSDNAKEANSRAVWYLSQREHGAEELYRKLCRYFTEQASAVAMAQMVELGYLDDARYARVKARSLLCAHKSRRAIAQKLNEVGIDRTVIADTLAELYQDDAMEADTEETQNPEVVSAMVLIERKYARKLAIGRKDLVVAALTRRGFSYGCIRTALEQCAMESTISIVS